jgi:hypothetical protein
MFRSRKSPLVLLALAALLVSAAGVATQQTANAAISDGVWFLSQYGEATDTDCTDGTPRFVRVDEPPFGDPLLSSRVQDGDRAELPSGGIIFCFEPVEGAGNVVLLSHRVDRPDIREGNWGTAVCGNLDVEDPDQICQGVGALTGSATIPDAGNDLSIVAIFFTCSGGPMTITISQNGQSMSFEAYCGQPATASMTATPDTIESHPARFNTAHSLIRVEFQTSGGGPAMAGVLAEIEVDRCAFTVVPASEFNTFQRRQTLLNRFSDPPIQDFLGLHNYANSFSPLVTSAAIPATNVDVNDDRIPDHSEVMVILHAEDCAPGPVVVSLFIDNPGRTSDIERTVTVTVIGPPAFMTISASPTSVVCGEKAQIAVSVTDALNQRVSDNTEIEVITNYGGVFGGTGSSLTSNQPVNPLSSTVVEVFDGVGIAYLLTSNTHVGQYEVLAASTPAFFGTRLLDATPVVAQVTVTCTMGDPSVTAPSTGTGASAPPTSSVGGIITPPNTGDAGLGQAQRSLGLLLIAAVIGLALAGWLRVANR